MAYVAGAYDYRNRCVRLKCAGSGEWHEVVQEHSFFLRGRPNAELADLFQDTEMEGEWCRCFVPAASAERKALVQTLEAHGVETYEGDVSPINRFLTDEDVPYGRPRVLWFDLETDGRPGWDRLSDHRILCIGYVEDGGKRRGVITAKNTKHGERDALEEFLDEVVSRHDLLVAWNGDAYDEPVLRARCEHLGLGDRWAEHWQGVNFLDMMRLFKKYYADRSAGGETRTSFALDAIAKVVLGRGKEKKPMRTRDGRENPVLAIVQAWEDGNRDLQDYCQRDVEIMVELEEKFGFLAFHCQLSNLCGRFPSSYTLWSGYLNDAYVLRWGRKHGMRFRTKYTFYDERLDVEQIEGAYVMKPIAGMYEQVCDLDFASLYPSVIRTFNISPEVKCEGGKPWSGPLAFNGQRFRKDVRGAFPQIVEETLELRKKYKRQVAILEENGHEGTLEHLRAKQTSDAYKLLGNTMYGIMSSPRLRYYDADCGEAVTKSGKAIIQHVIALAAKRGMGIYASDTDSLFVGCSKEQALAFAADVAADIDRFVEERGGFPGMIRMDLDVVYERIVFVVAKRYFGLKDTGALDVKGLEFVRTDGCRVMREMQRRIIEYLLMADRPTARKAAEIVGRYRDRVLSGGLGVEGVVLTQALGKGLDDYKVDPPHVRVAKALLAAGQEVYEGMKIPYFISGTDAKGKQVVEHASKFCGRYDEQFYWQKKVYPPTKAILDVVFREPAEQELLSGLNPKKPRKARAGGKKGQADARVRELEPAVRAVRQGPQDQPGADASD